MRHKTESTRHLFLVFAILMALFVLTVGASRAPLGRWNIVLAMTIAALKAMLVVLFFMHVLRAGKLVWFFAGSAFLWLVILLVLTFNDYMTRSTLPRGAPAQNIDIYLPTRGGGS